MGIFSRKAATFKPLPMTDPSLMMLNQMLYNYVMHSSVYQSDNPQGYIDNGYMLNADVYAIIKRISKTAASCPFVLHEIKSKSDALKYAGMSRMSNQKNHELHKLRKKAFAPVTDNPVMNVLKNPNPDQSAFEFWENYLGFKLLLGNGYIYGAGPDAGNNAGQFQQMYILPAHLMQIVSGGIMEPVAGYKMMYRGTTQTLPAERVMHGRNWTPDYSGPASHLYGLSPLRAASQVLMMSNDAVTASAKMFTNMGAQGVLYMDDPQAQAWTKEQQQAMNDSYNNKYGGPNKAGTPIITSSKVGWQQIGMSPVDLNIIESQKMTQRQLCNIYGMSSSLLNDPDNKTYNNMEQAKKELITNAVLPELISLRDDLNRWLLPGYDKTGRFYLDFDISVFPEMAEDLETMATTLVKCTWMSTNEKRESYGLDPMPDPLMDKILIPNNVMLLDDLESIPEIDELELTSDGANDAEPDTGNSKEPQPKAPKK